MNGKTKDMHARFAMLAAAALAAAAASIVPADLHAAASVVVRSAGPSARALPPGRSLGENVPLVLKAGDVVTVIAPSGARTLRGPGTFRLAGGAAPALQSRGRFSARRGDDAPAAPGLWDVDVSAGGTHCTAGAEPVLLWRADAAAPLSLEIAPASGAAGEVAWAAGSHMQRWPAAVPLADGAEYRLGAEGGAKPLRIRTLPAAEKDPAALARAFIAAGCEAQLDRLIATSQVAEG